MGGRGQGRNDVSLEAKAIFRNSLAIETDLAFVTSKLWEPLAEDVGPPGPPPFSPSGSRSLSQEDVRLSSASSLLGRPH